MDVDRVSGYLSDERKSRSKNTRSLERPLDSTPGPDPQLPYPTHPTCPLPNYPQSGGEDGCW